MKTKLFFTTCAATLILAVSQAWAHHSIGAIFDTSKSVQVTGTLTEMRWINPHAYYLVDVAEGDQVVQYRFEGMPPGMMRSLGMSRDVWTSNIGKEITVQGIGARNGDPTLAFGLVVTFSDGVTWELFPPESEF